MVATLPLIVLPGGLGKVEVPDDAFSRLASTRHVIHYEYPPGGTLDELFSDMSAVLDREGMSQVDMLGSSVGGYLAQCFVRRYTGRVRNLILAHTYALTAKEARQLAMGQRVARWLPHWVFRMSVRLKVMHVLKPVKRLRPSEYPQIAAGIVATLPRNLTPAVVQRNNSWMIEAQHSFPLPPHDVLHGLRVLIIESANDPIVRERSRAELRRLYPAAQVHRFADAGHVSALAQPEEFARIVTEFLSESSSQ